MRTEQRKKKRNFRLQDNVIRHDSTLIHFDGIYPEYKFARTKLNDVHYIFETSSGYVVGQGKSYNFARNTSKEYLNSTNGKFNLLVEHFQLDKTS
jgi:hypothetical protein